MRLMPYRITFHARLRPLLSPEQLRMLDERQQDRMQRMSRRHAG